MSWLIKKTADFDLTSPQPSQAWAATQWVPVVGVAGACTSSYRTEARMLWSATGIYVMVRCEDRLLTCRDLGDFGRLWSQDVVEVFLWPDEANRAYFEYELSPLGRELPLMVVQGKPGPAQGWLPFEYEGPRRVRTAVSVEGGPATNGPVADGAAVTGWLAQMHIPFELLCGLGGVPPQSGDRWRGNVYRIDYDQKPPSHWAWTDCGPSFHNIGGFGELVFE